MKPSLQLKDLPNARECPDEQRNSPRTASMEHARQTSHSTWSSPTQAPTMPTASKAYFRLRKEKSHEDKTDTENN
jgi:hypothetical protein